MKQTNYFILVLILSLTTVLLLFLTFILSSIPVKAASADEIIKTGWVGAQATVPSDFNGAIIVCVQSVGTGEEYDIQIVPDNKYMGRAEVPEGMYQYSSSFVQGGDYRYSVTPAEDYDELAVTSGAAAALINVNVALDEDLVDGAKLPDEEASQLSDNVSDPVEEEPVLSEEGSSEETSEAGNSSEDVSEPEKETEPNEGSNGFLHVLKRIIISISAAAIFAGLVIVVVYTVRKYNL